MTKPRYDAYDRQYPSHKHGAGPFIKIGERVIDHGKAYIVKTDYKTPGARQTFTLPLALWIFREVQ